MVNLYNFKQPCEGWNMKTWCWKMWNVWYESIIHGGFYLKVKANWDVGNIFKQWDLQLYRQTCKRSCDCHVTAYLGEGEQAIKEGAGTHQFQRFTPWRL